MLCVCMFEKYFEKCLSAPIFVMILVSLRTHTKCLFLKIFQKSVCVKRDIFLWASDYELSTYSKSLSRYFTFPLDSAILPLLSRKPYHWMFDGHARVIIQSQRKLVGLFKNCGKGLRSFYRSNIERVIEGLWSFNRRVFAKESHVRGTWLFLFEATSEGHPRGAHVQSVLCFSYFNLGFMVI